MLLPTKIRQPLIRSILGERIVINNPVLIPVLSSDSEEVVELVARN